MFFLEEKKCAKCGRPAAAGQAFCPDCLAAMEKYPVKSGVVVLLPHREPQQIKPAPRRRGPQLSAEELVKRLKKDVFILVLALVLTIAALCGMIWGVASDFFEDDSSRLLPGQNYSAENASGPVSAD